METLQTNENIDRTVNCLISQYSLANEVAERLKEKISVNIDKYGIETTDDYISEMMQSNFEILKEKMNYEKVFKEFEYSIMKDYFGENKNRIINEKYIATKREELDQILDELIRNYNEISYSVNKIQNSPYNKSTQKFELTNFSDYELFKNKILDVFDKSFGDMIKNDIDKDDSIKVIDCFEDSLFSIYHGSKDNMLKQYKEALRDFYDDLLDDKYFISYNTNIKKKKDIIRKSAIEVTNSIDSIEKYNYKDKLKPEILKELYEIKEQINKKRFRNFGELTRKINEYKKIACEIWKDYLDGSDEEKGEFRYLMHNLGQREYYNEFKDPVISTSLITDKHIAFHNQTNIGSPNGFIIKPNNIVSAAPFDDFINNTVDGNSNKSQKFQLPYELEFESVNEAKERDGEILTYFSREKPYSGDCNEIACNDFEIVGYFIMTFGEGELNHEYAKAKRMADARNIDLKEIDFVKLRMQNGLTPMTDDMKKDLLYNIIISRNRNLKEDNPNSAYLFVDEQFIEDNYVKFANRYLNLKNTPNFNTQTILEQLSIIENEYEKKKMVRPTENDLKSQIQPSTISESIRRLKDELQNEFFDDEKKQISNRG